MTARGTVQYSPYPPPPSTRPLPHRGGDDLSRHRLGGPIDPFAAVPHPLGPPPEVPDAVPGNLPIGDERLEGHLLQLFAPRVIADDEVVCIEPGIPLDAVVDLTAGLESVLGHGRHPHGGSGRREPDAPHAPGLTRRFARGGRRPHRRTLANGGGRPL